MDRLDSLRVFVRAAELGSFSRAAENLGLPRATVSAAIAGLEAQFGARLFQRTTRRVSLTSDGEALLERSRALLEEFEALRALLRPPAAGVTGRLVVALPSRIAQRVVIPRLPALLGQHPGLEIDLHCDDRLVDLIDEGVDCALRVGTLDSSSSCGSLVARPLGRLRLINCASPGYLAEHPPLESPHDLERHLAIHYGPRRGAVQPALTDWEYVDEHGEPQRRGVRCRIGVHDAQSYLACARAGLGLIQIPAFDAHDAIARGALVEVLPGHRPPSMPIHALYPHRRHLSPRVRMFLGWLQEVLEETPG